MDNKQNKNQTESGQSAETTPAENSSANETKAACGCCGGKKLEKN